MKIVIFQPMLKFYRVALFECLHKQLLENGHELRLVFGTPWEAEKKRKDNVVLENDYSFFERSYWFFKNKLHIMPSAIKHIVWADIVITEQANKHLHNYILILLSLFNIKPFAYWGHGLNRQGKSNSIREKIKKILATQVDWWFAYSGGVAGYLKELGFPEQRISILYNSIDTKAFERDLNQITIKDLEEFKLKHGIASDAKVALFCGSLYQDKKIDFLLEAAKSIHKNNPKFLLLIGGSGQEQELVEQYASQYSFIIYLGAIHGRIKQLAFKCSDLFLCPGPVGLAILDAFTASLPLYTTINPGHGPEIEYLQENHNGMISPPELQLYSDLVNSALESEKVLKQMQKNALATAHEFSIENMANNFVNGIQSFALNPHK